MILVKTNHGFSRAVSLGRCRKVPFRTKAKARKKQKQLEGSKSVYQCPYCNQWHTSSVRGKVNE